MAVTTSTADAEMEEPDDPFDGFSQDDGFIEVSKRKKRKMLTSPTHNAGKTQSSAEGSSNNNHARDYNKNQDPVIVIIVREDKKQIPLNFINSAKPSWEVINCIDPETLTRINKGTIIKGCILPNKLETYAKANRNFQVNE